MLVAFMWFAYFLNYCDRQAVFSSVRIVLLDEHEKDGSLTVPRRDFFVYNDEVTAEFVFAEPNMTVEHIQVSTEADHVGELAHEYSRIREHSSTPYLSAATVPRP